jgi:putative DNA primase/helicase
MTSSLREIASALGGEVMKSPKGGQFILCPGPGHSARDRSLSVTPSATSPHGLVVHSFSPKDDWRTCRDHVLKRLGLPSKPQVNPSDLWADIWKAAGGPRGTIVEQYLASRGLELPDDLAGRVVRFHPACPFGQGTRQPCMITAFRSIADDTLQAIHRTALTPDGKKIDRKMLGPVAGAAIKIDADENVEQGLMIGEGFETCLAARQLGLRPVWALGSAGAIANFPVLAGVDALTILAETDDSGANAKAIRACGNRWAAAGREVIVATPYVRGDMNEALRA